MDNGQTRTRWARQAAATYDAEHANRYRAHDEDAARSETVHRLGEWLRAVCARCGTNLDVLDLGCGTGRYFHALAGVRRLVGVDASKPMLERARSPVGGLPVDTGLVTLREADLLTCEFADAEFDLVYSIGVLAEHAPFDASLTDRVARWLKPGGRFAFTTVHPSSFSIRRTLKRRAAEAAASCAPAGIRRALRSRLMRDGIYADEERVREIVEGAGLAIESMERFTSDAHLHVLAVASKRAGRS